MNLYCTFCKRHVRRCNTEIIKSFIGILMTVWHHNVYLILWRSQKERKDTWCPRQKWSFHKYVFRIQYSMYATYGKCTITKDHPSFNIKSKTIFNETPCISLHKKVIIKGQAQGWPLNGKVVKARGNFLSLYFWKDNIWISVHYWKFWYYTNNIIPVLPAYTWIEVWKV